MERAGAAAAVALSLLPPSDAPVLVACGPGNNGGDGFVVARHLRSAGHRVSVAFAADPTRLPADAAVARAAWLAAGGSTDASLPPPPPQGWALVVDALFGIGLQRPIEGLYADWIENLSASSGLRLALDIPSGLDADTGHHPGACFRADHTVTFIALKPGLLTLDGPDHCGTLHLATSTWTPKPSSPAPGHTVATELFSARLHPRQRNSHKGSYGDAALIGGAPGMVGAALLAGRAAAYLGAGRVLVGLLDPAALAVDVERPELMFRDAATLLGETGLGALGVGPGLGQSDAARALVATALAASPPAPGRRRAEPGGAGQPAPGRPRRPRPGRRAHPHPAEAARLLGSDTGAIQADRIAAACALARRYRAWVVLKGCGSVIAGRDGAGGSIPVAIRPWPPPAWVMCSPESSAPCWPAAGHPGSPACRRPSPWRGRRHLCAEQGLDTGLLAGEVAEAARRSLNHWLRACAPPGKHEPHTPAGARWHPRRHPLPITLRLSAEMPWPRP
jgi:hydroxyethylthiazole kinase-like uncharacterized protein yjeF